jgi:ATP-dependent RNA helicase DeaD
MKNTHVSNNTIDIDNSMNKEKDFSQFNLSKDILTTLKKNNYKVPTKIQSMTIPLILEQKKDILAVAQTGTGKTGAFGIPLVEVLGKNKKLESIILTPTRELAIQISNELNKFKGNKNLKILTIYGGSSINSQIKSLRMGVDIVVGTPGRVKDLIERGELRLKDVSKFILDEADEMLNMGFIEDIEFILSKVNNNRNIYLFSATMPKRIELLSKKFMKSPEIVRVKNKTKSNNLISHSFYRSKFSEKEFHLKKIIKKEDFFYGVVFCKTKSDVDNLTMNLKKDGYKVDKIHGDITQFKREKVLNKFRNQKINILVATDVAARGIDISNLTHVINHSLPRDVETYTHRTGRTGRAGNKGEAISLVTPAEMKLISLIERENQIEMKKKIF